MPAAWALEENQPEILRDDGSELRFYHSALLHCPVAELCHPNLANAEEWCRNLKKFEISVLQTD